MDVIAALTTYGAVFTKTRKSAAERLDLLAVLMWVHVHQLDLHAVWPVQPRYSAPTSGRLLSVNCSKFCPILPRSTKFCTKLQPVSFWNQTPPGPSCPAARLVAPAAYVEAALALAEYRASLWADRPILDRLVSPRPRFEAPAAERTLSVLLAEAERLVTTPTPPRQGGRLRSALQALGAAAGALPGARPAPPPLRFSGPVGPARTP
jgi:hypothetical protein